MTAHELDGVLWRKSSYSAANGACVEVGWRKSSHSNGNGDCVEVGWRKSNHSAANGDCVEVAALTSRVLVRDSKNPGGPTLSVTVPRWRAFLTRVTR